MASRPKMDSEWCMLQKEVSKRGFMRTILAMVLRGLWL